VFADGNAHENFLAGHIDHAQRAGVFVRGEDLRSVLAERRLLGIRPAVKHAHDFPLSDIENPDPVGSFVGRRQLALVDARPGDWRAAERNK